MASLSPPYVPPVLVTTGLIDAKAVTNAKLADAAAGTIKSNLTGAPASPSDNTLAAISAALAILNLKAGTALTNADVSHAPASDAASLYVLPTTTLTGNHTLTLATTGSPATGLVVTVIRRDLTAHTYAVINGGVGAGTLLTFASAPATAQGARFIFGGTNWTLVDFFYVAA
jgi:hypothetical protein